MILTVKSSAFGLQSLLFKSLFSYNLLSELTDIPEIPIYHAQCS